MVCCPEKAQEEDQRKGVLVDSATEDVSESNGDATFACCGWEGKLYDYIKNHCNGECLFVEVKCPLSCDKMIPVRGLEAHKTSNHDCWIVTCSH